MTLLRVEALDIQVGGINAVSNVSFSIAPGERVGLIGESGSGKSLTALSIMGLLAEGIRASGSIKFDSIELLSLSEKAMAGVRGDRLTMIFQEPMTSLNPVLRIGHQVAEPLRIHREVSRREAREHAADLLGRARIADVAEVIDCYPHQLSGGQRQRVMIAIALACSPTLIIADEPTTALDVTVEAEVINLLRELVEEDGTALLFISHDLAVVRGLCDQLQVMYGGRIVERGPASEVLQFPMHPYTSGLREAVLRVDLREGGTLRRLPTIPGAVPALGQFPKGCVFRDRCSRATSSCFEEPVLTLRDGDRAVACWHPLTEN